MEFFMNDKNVLTKEEIKDKIDLFNRMINILNLVDKGMPMHEACEKNNIAYTVFRGVLRINFEKDFMSPENPSPAVPKPDEEPTWKDKWKDKFVIDVLGPLHSAPPDFYKAYEKATEGFSEREHKAIKLRYKEEYTLEEIGKVLNISRERVRQILAKAIRRLKHPARSKYFIYGADAEYISELERKQNNMLQKRDKYKKELADRNMKLETEINQLKEKCSDEMLKSIEEDDKSIDELNLSNRAYNCLTRARIRTIGQLKRMTFNDFMQIRYMGKKSFNEIKDQAYLIFRIKLPEE